jgi:hypothetical protein
MAFHRYLIGAALASSLVVGAAAAPAFAAHSHATHAVHAKKKKTGASGDVSANPSTATETTKGSVSFALVGKDLIPNTKYKFDATTLSTDCKNNVNGKSTTTDLKGAFNFAATAGPNCVSGKFSINVQEDSSPYTIYSAVLTLAAP